MIGILPKSMGTDIYAGALNRKASRITRSISSITLSGVKLADTQQADSDAALKLLKTPSPKV